MAQVRQVNRAKQSRFDSSLPSVIYQVQNLTQIVTGTLVQVLQALSTSFQQCFPLLLLRTRAHVGHHRRSWLAHLLQRPQEIARSGRYHMSTFSCIDRLCEP